MIRLLFAVTLASSASKAAGIDAHGLALVVSAGKYSVGAASIEVVGSAKFSVEPAPVVAVTGELLQLSAEPPEGREKGTPLRGVKGAGVSAVGSLVPGSVEIRRTADGALLKEGTDYLLDAEWGHVGLGPSGRATAAETVSASYRYSLLRIDTIQASKGGRASLKLGKPDLSSPIPPEPDDGHVAIAHVFMPYGAKGVGPDQIYPLQATPAQAPTRSSPGRLPKTLAKLRAGRPVKIVCWGDSVTAGGDASSASTRFCDLFVSGLRERFPRSKIEAENISLPGSHSRQWLFPDRVPFRGLRGAASPAQFARVTAAKADLVTIEFVNDSYMGRGDVDRTYGEIIGRLESVGAEAVILTPHFTAMRSMGFKTLREADRRPYTLALRGFAERRHVALADASARWEHLWKEGVPYVTLLKNTFNHPDDRGHRLFAEELWKCLL